MATTTDRPRCRWPAPLLLTALLSLPAAWAAELGLRQYADLSVARLELSLTAWTTTGQPPVASAMAALFARFGVTEAEYLAYTSEHRQLIADYLANHPEAQARIDELSAAIAQAIAE